MLICHCLFGLGMQLVWGDIFSLIANLEHLAQDGPVLELDLIQSVANYLDVEQLKELQLELL